MKALILSAWVALSATAAEAKLFDISKETFATYVLATGGPSNVKQTPFQNATSGTGLSSDEFKLNLGGEFGFLYSTPNVNLRFGFEILKPAAVGAKFNNASGTELYDVKSDLTGYAPKLGIEINFKPQGWYRGFVLLSAGQAFLTMKNDYTLTAAGKTAYSGVSDHSVEAKSSAAEFGAGVGIEFLMSDNTTIMAEAGYRSLKFSELKYTKDVTTFSGAQKSGDLVNDISGNKRQIDMSGAVVSLGLRIYL